MISLMAALVVLCFGEKDFEPVEEDSSFSLLEKAHAWVAATPYAHEILLLDPEDSPLLSAYYEWNKDAFSLAARESAPALFCKISSVLHNEIFTNIENPRKGVAIVRAKWGHPCVPLDIFIDNHSGVCRHFVLAAAYFLARLQSENLLSFQPLEIRIIRENLIYGGRHAWLQVGSWHFDPYWNLIADMANTTHREFLYHVYGPVGIDNIKVLGERDYVEDDPMLRGFERMGQKSR
jgi:hypothetical protein